MVILLTTFVCSITSYTPNMMPFLIFVLLSVLLFTLG